MSPQVCPQGPEVSLTFKEAKAHLSSPGQGVAPPTAGPSFSGLQSHPVRRADKVEPCEISFREARLPLAGICSFPSTRFLRKFLFGVEGPLFQQSESERHKDPFRMSSFLPGL